LKKNLDKSPQRERRWGLFLMGEGDGVDGENGVDGIYGENGSVLKIKILSDNFFMR
jgi:hypothetical protein